MKGQKKAGWTGWQTVGVGVCVGLFLAVTSAGTQSADPVAAAKNISVGVNPFACNGNCDFASIQDAIKAAASGDTIWVYAGTYKGPIEVDKSVSILATGDRGSTVIDGTGSNHIVRITANGVKLAGFTLQNSNKEGVVVWTANNAVISDNLIRGTGQVPPTSFFDVANAINIHNGDFNQVLNNTIIDNGGRGTRIEGFEGIAEGNVVRGNLFRNNTGGCTIVVTTNVANNLIEGNRIEWSYDGAFIVAALLPDAIAKGNVFQHNEVKWSRANPGALISLTAARNPDQVSGNVIRYNQFESPDGYRDFPASGTTGVVIQRATGNAVYGNKIINADTGVAVTVPLSVAPNEVRDNQVIFVRTAFVDGAPAAAPAPGAPASAAPAQLPRTGGASFPTLVLAGLGALALGFGLVLRQRARAA